MKTIEENGINALITLLECHGHTIERMHVAVGNIYRCEVLDGWHWMYEEVFKRKATEFLSNN